MKCNSLVWHGGIFLSLLIAFTGVVVVRRRPVSARLSQDQVDDNSQKFYLWRTGTSISYSFNCEPRAADEWLFRTGGGLLAGTNRSLELTNVVIGKR
jgi:hypothetical protein